MRRFTLLIMVILIVVVAVVGYQHDWYSFTFSSDDRGTDVGVRLNTEQWQRDREEFQKDSDAGLKSTERRLDELKAKAAKAGGEVQKEMKVEVDRLHQQCLAARAKLGELGNAGKETWDDLKTKLGQSMNDLKHGISQAEQRFNK
jgi:hypothetical protein